MKSETWTIQQVFQDRKQYKVPFYQRAYVWTFGEAVAVAVGRYQGQGGRAAGKHPACAALLGRHRGGTPREAGLRGVDTLHIIDGQRRLTTLQYVLAGIRFAARELKIPDYDSYLAAVLDNPHAPDRRDGQSV
jgi:hypothetical protein